MESRTTHPHHEFPGIPRRITKFMIDSVYFLTQNSRVTPLYLPYRYWSEIASMIRIGRVGCQEYPPETKSKVFYKLGQPSASPVNNERILRGIQFHALPSARRRLNPLLCSRVLYGESASPRKSSVVIMCVRDESD